MQLVKLCSAVILVLSLFSCNKDKLEEDKNSHRIKEIIATDYEYGFVTKMVFSYDDERIEQVEYYRNLDNEYVLLAKKEYSYSDQDIKIEHFELKNDSWELEGKVDLIMDQNKVIKESQYYLKNNELELSIEYTFEYIGDNLHKYNGKVPHEGKYVDFFKGEFGILDGKVVNFYKYSYNEQSWDLFQVDTFTYIGNKRDYWSILSYSPYIGHWINDFKYTYHYSADKITSCKKYHWWAWTESWEEIYDCNYIYDEQGYLVEYIKDGAPTYYTYEEGHGNADQVWLDPEDLNFGFPKLKSSSIPKSYVLNYYGYSK